MFYQGVVLNRSRSYAYDHFSFVADVAWSWKNLTHILYDHYWQHICFQVGSFVFILFFIIINPIPGKGRTGSLPWRKAVLRWTQYNQNTPASVRNISVITCVCSEVKLLYRGLHLTNKSYNPLL